jgi:tetratricopeptide (TPR) repeat protein
MTCRSSLCPPQPLELGLEGTGERAVADALEDDAKRAYEAGRVEEAVWAAERVVAIRTAVRAKADEAKARCEAGASLLASGAAGDAEAELARARDLAREAGEALVEARSLALLGELYARCGRIVEAAALLEQARSLCAALPAAAGEVPRGGAHGHHA